MSGAEECNACECIDGCKGTSAKEVWGLAIWESYISGCVCAVNFRILSILLNVCIRKRQDWNYLFDITNNGGQNSRMGKEKRRLFPWGLAKAEI